MRKINVVVSTLSEEVFEELVNKFEEMGVTIIEKRYDLLYHRHEIYVRLNYRQCYTIQRFTRPRNASLISLR